MSDEMNIKIAEAVGIETPNCLSCAYKSTDDDGGEPEYSQSWDICSKEENERFNNLKTFPFKKLMKCWIPEFWSSKFADMIHGTDDVDGAYKAFNQAINRTKATGDNTK